MCIQVQQHASQVCACLQPGVCLQVCPQGHGSCLLACLRVLPAVGIEESLRPQVSTSSEVGVDVGRRPVGQSGRFAVSFCSSPLLAMVTPESMQTWTGGCCCLDRRSRDPARSFGGSWCRKGAVERDEDQTQLCAGLQHPACSQARRAQLCGQAHPVHCPPWLRPRQGTSCPEPLVSNPPGVSPLRHPARCGQAQWKSPASPTSEGS